MRVISARTAVAAVTAAVLTAAGATAQAAPLGTMPAQGIAAVAQTGDSGVTPVQYWRHRHHRGYGWRGHRYHRHRYHRHRDRDNVGAAIAGGIIGLAAGAIIAGSAPRSGRTVQYCINRFRSYDVASRTYLGYDGRRHSCP